MNSIVIFRNIKDEIISNLLKANSEIKVAVAWLTDEDIIRVLTQKQQSGVRVQVALSDKEANFLTANVRKWKEFLRFHGQLYVSTPIFLHHKFCIIDDNIILNGSYNWSYPAKDNEENLIIMTIDSQKQEDFSLMQKFVVRHQYLCNKCSVPINDIHSLNVFANNGRNIELILTNMDEEEILLREAFEEDVRESLKQSSAAGISPSPFLLERMKSDGGGVRFVKRILKDEMTSGDMKSGFKRLEAPIPHLVHLSLEFLVCKPEYISLFTTQEIEFCRELMAKYGL